MAKHTKNSFLYEQLKDRWTKRHRKLQDEIFSKHKDSFRWFVDNSRQFTISSLAGIMLLVSPMVPKIPVAFSSSQGAQVSQEVDKKVFVIYDLRNVLSPTVGPLTQQQENAVSEVLTRDYGIRTVPELDGIRLNTTYGIIGQEQHLARYPGDSMFSHFDNSQSAEQYWSYGMAPGLGAWGYFADSQSSMTTQDIEREKYYIAVQTFLSPGYEQNTKKYNDFFKYRKMLVVNPQNGKAIVADIADSGPAPWTGKQLGGSPEVMKYLDRQDGEKKGPVLYFFIDDPNNMVPLGPVSL